MKNNTTNVMICNKKIIAQTIDNQDRKQPTIETHLSALIFSKSLDKICLILFCDSRLFKSKLHFSSYIHRHIFSFLKFIKCDTKNKTLITNNVTVKIILIFSAMFKVYTSGRMIDIIVNDKESSV